MHHKPKILSLMFCLAVLAPCKRVFAEDSVLPVLHVRFDSEQQSALTDDPEVNVPVTCHAPDGPAADFLREGIISKALYVSRTNPAQARIGLTDVRDLSQPMTMMAWIKPTRNRRHIIIDAMSERDGQYAGYRLYLDYFYRLRVQVGIGNRLETIITDKYSTETNYWAHVAAVLETDKLTLYVNAAKVAQKHITPSLPTITKPPVLHVGTHGYRHSFPFQGLIDDVKIFDMAMTENDIVQAAREW